MKNLTLFVLMLIASVGFTQNAPVDFETGGNGADWTWNVFENDTNPALEFIANPDASEPNTSATVAKITALQTGQPWAGTECVHGEIGVFDLTTDNCIIKIMVHKPVISDVGIKLVKPDGWSMGEIKVANTVINEWEELTFDFSGQLESGYDQIVVFPDFDLDGRAQDNIVYFDNITFNAAGSGGNEPTVAAPTPTVDAGSVISMFSDAYTDVVVDTWYTDWSVGGGVADVMIEGNTTKKYVTLSYAGITTEANQIDASSMTHMHVDVWSADFTVFKVKLVDFGADGAFGGDDDSEHEVTVASPAQSEWVSVDVPLSDFTSLASVSNLAQYVISADGSTIFLDNMYFYSGSSSINEVNNNISSVYPNPVQNNINIVLKDIHSTYNLQILDLSGRVLMNETINKLNTKLDVSDFNAGSYMLVIKDQNNAIIGKQLIIKK
jgi:hypothetical protein